MSLILQFCFFLVYIWVMRSLTLLLMSNVLLWSQCYIIEYNVVYEIPLMLCLLLLWVVGFKRLADYVLQVRDLDFSIKVIGSEITRENDGLAMSSRNVHLSPEEREKVLILFIVFNYLKLAVIFDMKHLCQ